MTFNNICKELKSTRPGDPLKAGNLFPPTGVEKKYCPEKNRRDD